MPKTKNAKKQEPRTKKILLVEDDPTQVMMYQAEISNHGYKVFVAKDKKEALSIAKERDLDLIFMDLLLGKENGVDVIKEIRKNKSFNNIIIVILSNYKKDDVKKNCKEMGVADYLIKTEFVPREIAEKIKEYIK